MSHIPNFPVEVKVSAVLPSHSDARVITRAIRDAITEICMSRACDGTLEIETAKHRCERYSIVRRINFHYRNHRAEISPDELDFSDIDFTREVSADENPERVPCYDPGADPRGSGCAGEPEDQGADPAGE